MHSTLPDIHKYLTRTHVSDLLSVFSTFPRLFWSLHIASSNYWLSEANCSRRHGYHDSDLLGCGSPFIHLKYCRIDVVHIGKRATVTDQDSNLAEIVSWFRASFTNVHVANPIKFYIIVTVEDEKFFVQDNIYVNNCCQFVYNRNFVPLKKAIYGSKQTLTSKEILLVLTNTYHVLLFLLFWHMLHVQTCIATYGEHNKYMSYALTPQEKGTGTLGMSLMLEKVKQFTETIRKGSITLFLLRFV